MVATIRCYGFSKAMMFATIQCCGLSMAGDGRDYPGRTPLAATVRESAS
jgi:hypothetical protein